MQASFIELLRDAQESNYAVGAFNVYNLEGIKAVVAAAEAEHSPAILQLHPSALKFGGMVLLAACLEAVNHSSIPMLVHLDHAVAAADIEFALKAGVFSVMADGSQLTLQENINFTRRMASVAHQHGAAIEAELGRLSGSEDGLSVAEYEAKLTDPLLAADFVMQTSVDSLAVCVGNVHGHYFGEPRLDFERLQAIQSRVTLPLVLHGASGLPDTLVHRAIDCGVRKFNVNTEVREAYLTAVRGSLQQKKAPDLIDMMTAATAAMQSVVESKLRLFRSNGRV
ncbi:MAG: class II fructose-bisphosphate aldolase [Anaerolineaceae bacterium]